jgi:hypothetical protein
MSADLISVAGGDGVPRQVRLEDYLDAEAAESAELEANRWIKRLRDVRVEGRPLRDWMTYRGDSLWWFVELYLHKQRAIVSIHRAIFALEALVARERPASIFAGDDPLLRLLVPQLARRHGIAVRRPAVDLSRRVSRLRLLGRARFHTLSALADRVRPGARRPAMPDAVDVVAFVHTAFWRRDRAEEGYIGPVLRELEARLPAGRLALVGLGPRTNFRMRRWKHRFAEFNDPQARALPFAPIELLAGPADIRASLSVWRSRRRTFSALCASADLRQAAVFNGCDAWPMVANELLGVTHLQLPWSARCMDEAAAALDALRPRVVVTYAEAGGWGRALALEARRRRIPLVGLQHGFIYRHWLNYLHEPDEMRPSAGQPSDHGFPYPDLTLLYDGFAQEHLVKAGSFPPSATGITGSPRLESFVETGRRMTAAERDRVRAGAGANSGQKLVVLATKFTQIGAWFAPLVHAVDETPGVHLVVKCHPAESAAPYEQAARSSRKVTVMSAGTDLAELVACADLIVTVNSTAALEAMALDVPGLVLALPNNLSPFVDAGALAGVSHPADIRMAISRLLYDEKERLVLAQARRTFIDRYGIVSTGGAAARAARTILQLVGRSADGGVPGAAAAQGAPRGAEATSSGPLHS